MTAPTKSASEEIADLRAQLAACQQERDDWQWAADQHQKAKDACQQDAKRYQWLRYGDHDEAAMMTYADGGSRKFDPRFDDCWLLRNADLDAAIDAALSGAKDNG